MTDKKKKGLPKGSKRTGKQSNKKAFSTKGKTPYRTDKKNRQNKQKELTKKENDSILKKRKPSKIKLTNSMAPKRSGKRTRTYKK